MREGVGEWVGACMLERVWTSDEGGEWGCESWDRAPQTFTHTTTITTPLHNTTSLKGKSVYVCVRESEGRGWERAWNGGGFEWVWWWWSWTSVLGVCYHKRTYYFPSSDLYSHPLTLAALVFKKDSVNDKRNVWALAEAVIAPRSHFYEKQMYDWWQQ